MMRSLYSGVSGLKNHQNRMDVVGNNISNVNTTGFKSSRVTFSDTLSQTISGASAATGTQGGTNPKQIGLGSSLSSIDTLFTDGSVQSTGVNTDLCLSGNGLFIVSSEKGVFYTRNGNFKFDSEGNYVNSDGYFVQGWMATKQGESISTNGQPGNINIPAGKSMAGTASTIAKFTQNLNSEEPLIKTMTLTLEDGDTVEVDTNGAMYKIGGTFSGTTASGATVSNKKIDSITLKMSDNTTTTETSGAYTVGNSKPLTTIMTVYDSLGSAHEVTVYLTKTEVSASGNKWTASVELGHAAGVAGTQEIVGSDGTTTTVTMNDVTIQFDTNGGCVTGTGNSVLTLTNGSGSGQSILMDFTPLTQYASSNTAFASADGNAPGTLKSISIDSAGVITGTYTNGLNVQEAQIAIAQFNNSSGLTKNGNSLYTESNNSGTPNVGTINGLGCTVTPSALEMSNVDMASELTDMIVTQRGYQSNSKIITVSDELLETLINMKR